MPKVTVQIDMEGGGSFTVSGKTPDAQLFIDTVLPLIDTALPVIRFDRSVPEENAMGATPETAVEGAPKKQGIFAEIYRRAQKEAKTDRQFVALVATYRHLFWKSNTTSGYVKKLAAHVRRPLSNASMAVKQASAARDIEEVKGSGTPTAYRPTAATLAAWRKFITQ